MMTGETSASLAPASSVSGPVSRPSDDPEVKPDRFHPLGVPLEAAFRKVSCCLVRILYRYMTVCGLPKGNVIILYR